MRSEHRYRRPLRLLSAFTVSLPVRWARMWVSFGDADRPGAVPMYPSIAKAARVTGKVVVRVTVKGGLIVQTDIFKPALASGGAVLRVTDA